MNMQNIYSKKQKWWYTQRHLSEKCYQYIVFVLSIHGRLSDMFSLLFVISILTFSTIIGNATKSPASHLMLSDYRENIRLWWLAIYLIFSMRILCTDPLLWNTVNTFHVAQGQGKSPGSTTMCSCFYTPDGVISGGACHVILLQISHDFIKLVVQCRYQSGMYSHILKLHDTWNRV